MSARPRLTLASRRCARVAALVLLATTAGSGRLLAQPEIVDTTFGLDGWVTTDFGRGTSAYASALAVQPDGKILVAGGAGGDFNVTRLLSTGAVDTTFGDAGYRTVSFGGEDTPTAMLRDPFGRILIVGYTNVDASGNPSSNLNFAAARLTSNGALDSAFNDLASPTVSNGNGRLVVEMGVSAGARAVAMEPGSSRVVMAGFANGQFGVVMLNGSGRPDPSFANGGKALLQFGANDSARAVTVQRNGRILVAGDIHNGVQYQMAVVRLTSAGVPDTTFGSGGWAVFDFGGPSQAEQIALQADQRIVVGGLVSIGNSSVGVARLTSAGALDSTFSGDGLETVKFGTGSQVDDPSALTIQADGKIVVSGVNCCVNGARPGVARLMSGGSLDPSFADDGRRVPVSAGHSGSPFAQALEPATGQIVIAGQAGSSAFVVRLVTDADGPPPLSTLSVNDVTVTEGSSGSTNVNFTVSLSGASNVPVTFRLATANGTAVSPGDYGGVSGGVLLMPGATSAVLQAHAISDVIDEPDETFTMVVSDVVGATVVKDVGTATILDDDVAVQITSPTSASSFTASQPLVSIGGTAADVQGLQNVTWSSSNGMTGVATGTSTWTASVPLGAGANVVTVTARGADGYTATDTLSIDVAQFTAYLAEGATSDFLDTRIALLNPGAIDTIATMTFARAGNTNVVQPVPVPAHTRVTVDPKTIPGLEVAEFSTAVTSSQPVVVDRTMSWDATGYGAHAETAVPAPSPTWYLAEGATHSGFDLFYLLQNPAAHETTVRVRYLRPSGAPLVKDYTLPASSRTNIWVNVEDFSGLGLALAATDVSAEITSLDATPIIVERALYLTSQGRTFNAGHESAGVTAPAMQWFLAEGATGPYFDLFVLIANPGDSDAQVRVTYLLTTGQTYSRTLTAPANSRSNIWVDQESFDGGATFPLADVAVSTTVTSQNDVPIIVERALWWPGDFATWHEAHNSAGATETGTVWALADGEVAAPGAASADETYILIANASAHAGTARVTLYFDDGTSTALDYPLPANSRTNVAVGPDFGSIVAGRTFGAVITSLGATPAQIVVERAMYRNAGGVTWAAGTNALATRLQ